MFRISARESHAWRDVAQNIGKLSLAGLFLTGTFLLAHAYADSPREAAFNSSASSHALVAPSHHPGRANPLPSFNQI